MFTNFIFADKKSMQEDGLNPIFSQNNLIEREDSVHSDLPMMPLSIILQTTGNFSMEHKLGEGGFGAVYKVR